MLLSIAWKNVWRNKLRSLIVIISITIGLLGGLFYLAFSNGMVQHQIGASIKTEISNIQLHNPNYLINDEITYTISNPSEKLNKIKQIDEVQAVTSRIKSMAMVSSANSGTGVTVYGIDIENEKKVSDLYTKLIDGSYFETKVRNPILIGNKLAEKLKVKINSKIVITIQDFTGNITYGAFKVVGIFKTHNTMFDQANVFVRNTDLAHNISFADNQTSEIAVLLKHNDFTDITVTKMNGLFSDEIANGKLVVRSWSVINPILKMLNEMTVQFTMIFVIIILVALSFGIVNTMLMAIMERVREIGMLMAIGMSKIRVFLMIMLETIFLSITGGVLGLFLSWILITITNTTGIDLASVAEGMNSIGYSSFVRPELSIFFYFFIGALVVITAMFASILPARKALKLKPSEAIRQDV
ncbi:MAG: FtsX-like permease family protein [Melioribacteraceae bacterium]|nr:FtsX-like permease family protein [Melioribacteraceae bacterium]